MRRCYLCGRNWGLEKHHVFGGSNRKKSEKYGMTVDLCHWCHNEPPDGVHHNSQANKRLKREFQGVFEQTHSREEFRAIFGKNYILEDEA